MQAVPLGFFHMLTAMAAGGLITSLAAHLRTPLARGYLLLNGSVLLVFSALALWLRWALPLGSLTPYEATAPWVAWEPFAWTLFAGTLAVHLLLVRAERLSAATRVGIAAAVIGLAALGISAAAYVPPQMAFALVLLTFLASALALGGVWSGWMLGHWYLVTPKLSPCPLLLMNSLLAGALVLQTVLVLGQIILVLAAGAGPTATGTLPGSFGWWLGLRAGIGVLLPLVLSGMVWRTARIRSMMAATGLLYITLGAVVSGDIIARVLLFAVSASGRPL